MLTTRTELCCDRWGCLERISIGPGAMKRGAVTEAGSEVRRLARTQGWDAGVAGDFCPDHNLDPLRNRNEGGIARESTTDLPTVDPVTPSALAASDDQSEQP